MVDGHNNADALNGTGRQDKLSQTRASFLWTNPLSLGPKGATGSPVRPHEVRYKVRYMQ